MSTAKFAQLKSIFTKALELREGEVAAYLDQACEGNARLRAQVEEMLRQARNADTELLTETPKEAEHALVIGSTLGDRFVLKQFVGRGGMGEVYLAEDLELGARWHSRRCEVGCLMRRGWRGSGERCSFRGR